MENIKGVRGFKVFRPDWADEWDRVRQEILRAGR